MNQRVIAINKAEPRSHSCDRQAVINPDHDFGAESRRIDDLADLDFQVVNGTIPNSQYPVGRSINQTKAGQHLFVEVTTNQV